MSLRVTIKAPDGDVATEVKEKFFKKLYEHKGDTVVFEVPDHAQADADEIIAFGKDKGCEGSSETYVDPLEEAEGVDFW